jgi:hypothetical protein
MKILQILRDAVVAALIVLFALASLATDAADPRESGPLALVITYHATPANRAALRQAMEDSEAKQFQRWKDEGVLQSARLLVNRHVDSITKDSLGVGSGRGSGVFLVIPYEYLVPANEYVAYLDGYVVPQMDGWMEEGVLARYGVFLARYPAGRPWQSMLILEYKDDQALGARDATTAKVRARLKDNPKWKAISDAKKNVRNEKPPVIADVIALR